MKTYVPKDAQCQAIQFDGSNRDEICKELGADPKYHPLWTSEDGQVYFECCNPPRRLYVKDWLLFPSLTRVASDDFDTWYMEIKE